jgi:ParB family chromosome partitioning protein
MEHTKELVSVPLAALVASPLNVRRYSSGQVEELAALIDSQGLLHNLVVTEQTRRLARGRGDCKGGGSTRVRFAVAAGERRRRALLLLQARGRLPKDHEVLCELVPPERALEVSIAENSGREPLHPADEFDAFKAMIDEGKGIEDVAARFGVSVLTVQRRLKLATLSPKLLALYRQDGINLDQLMALTLSDEHAVQEAAWFGVPQWEQSASAIRRRLTAGEVEAAGSALVRFVGIEAYELAGGAVKRDLFDTEQGRFVCDPALLQRLASEKLEAIAESVQGEGWGWVEVRLDVDHQALRRLTPADCDLRKPDASERRELSELTQRSRELVRQSDSLQEHEEGWQQEAELIDLEERDIAARQRAIQQGMRVWAPAIKAVAGVIVTVGREGDAEVIRGLLRDSDRKVIAASRARAQAAARRATAGDPPPDADHTGVSGDGDDQGGSAATTPEPAVPQRAEFSEAMTRRLAAHRTLALQVMLSRNTPVAVVALAHALALRVFGDDYRRTGAALQITAQASVHALTAAADDLKTAPAWLAFDTARDAWIERLPQDRSAWFAWLLELPQAELLDLLAMCAASTVSALPSTGTALEANALAVAVGLDMADWWTPTAEGFLNHVSKAQIVQALKEAAPGLTADGVESMKKDVLVSTASARLAGKRWLPTPLRRPTA